jgi:hypothetical protein
MKLRYSAVIIPAGIPENVMLAMTFKLRTDTEELFAIIMKLFENNSIVIV